LTHPVDWDMSRRSVYTYSDGSEKSLGYIGHYDSNEKDDSVEPIIAEYECDDEEWDAEEDRNAGDEVNKVRYLTSYRRLTVPEAWRQVGDAAHHCTITRVHHQTTTRTYSNTHTARGATPQIRLTTYRSLDKVV